MKDVNIIIPLHVFNDDVKKSLEKAIGSVPEGMPITISTTKELIGEISNFAKDSFQSRHNLNYWDNNTYYGFGVSAHGYENGARYFNPTT